MKQAYLTTRGGGTGGEPGVGIESIEQTVTSTESGGENVMTVTREDGGIAGTFSVFNGAKGDPGEPGKPGRDGYDVHDAQIYSTEETVIGQWINGKPLYRKVYFGSLSDAISDGYREIILDSFIDKKLKASFGNAERPSVSYSIPFAWTAGNPVINVWTNESDNLMISFYGGFRENPLSFEVVAEYIKTTDEATIAIATIAELDAAYNEGVQAA